MRILHYALGFPPYRTGGLTKFCIDLMKQQCRDGHQAALLWPGQIGMFFHKVFIRDRGIVPVVGEDCGVQSFEIINPLPVPYDEGISELETFKKNGSLDAYDRLLDTFHPDVIHIHTLMGLHASFLEAARKKNIRRVFTVHDYFPVCPKLTLVRHGQSCTSAESCTECGVCNTTALSLKKIMLLQSPLYRYLKDTAVVHKLRAYHRGRYLSGEMESENTAAATVNKNAATAMMNENSVMAMVKENSATAMANENSAEAGTAMDYKKLRGYYYSLLKSMDMIHYNSSVAKSVYESFFQLPNSVIISISHGDIGDHKKKKDFFSGRLRMTYLGQQRMEKGFFLLQAALDELWKTDKSFCLNLYFTPKKRAPYMKIYGRYSYSELERIFDNTDLLVVPSIWKETFGYVVLEALSYGVPVLISGNVGARDILAAGAGIVIEDICADSLYHSLKRITSRQLSEMNRTILERQEILTVRCMARLIEERCYRVEQD